MVNFADRMVGTVQELQLRFGDKYSQIIQAENSTYYISVETSHSTYIMRIELIPLKNASSKYLLTIYRLRFYSQQRFPDFTAIFASYSKVRQMTLISNHTLMFMENPLDGVKSLKFLNFTAQTYGYINISSQLLASFAIDKNLSRHHFGIPILYTWINDSIYITSSTSTYRLTRQQLQFVISKQNHNTDWSFSWEYSKYL